VSGLQPAIQIHLEKISATDAAWNLLIVDPVYRGKLWLRWIGPMMLSETRASLHAGVHRDFIAQIAPEPATEQIAVAIDHQRPAWAERPKHAC
jgi:hypothetical protein